MNNNNFPIFSYNKASLIKLAVIEEAGEKVDTLESLKFCNEPDYTLRLLADGDEEACTQFYIENKQHLEIYETILPSYFHTQYWKEKITENRNDFINKKSCCLGIFSDQELIGMINYTTFVYGRFYSCYLGYKIASKHQGKGIMKKGLEISIDYVFNQLNMHRIAANYIPTNIRSAAILESMGFIKEGFARNYLFINGKWEDHVLTAIVNHNWKPQV